MEKNPNHRMEKRLQIPRRARNLKRLMRNVSLPNQLREIQKVGH
jgi:hypothetical protein